MLKAVRKSDKELLKESNVKLIKVKEHPREDHKGDWWHCYRCNVVFQSEDFVLLQEHGEIPKVETLCPLIKSKHNFIWGFLMSQKEQCLGTLTYAAPNYFQENYKLG